MKKEYKTFARQFAASIIARDYLSAHSMFAPWLQREVSPSKLQEMIEAYLRELAEVWERDEMVYPADCRIDSNPCSLQYLRSDFTAGDMSVPDEVTDENFRQWLCIEFLPDADEEFDACFDFWMGLVEIDGQHRVGFFDIADAD